MRTNAERVEYRVWAFAVTTLEQAVPHVMEAVAWYPHDGHRLSTMATTVI